MRPGKTFTSEEKNWGTEERQNICLICLFEFLTLWVNLLNRVWLFATPWTVAYQAPPSMDCTLPGSSLHGILQARVLEWVAISFFRGSSQPRDGTWVSCIPGRRFNLWATREVPDLKVHSKSSKWFVCFSQIAGSQEWYCWVSGKNTENCTKKIFTTQIITMVWSPT